VALPAAAFPSVDKGIVTFAYRGVTSPTAQIQAARLFDVQTGITNACYIQTQNGSGALSLYVDGQFRGTSAPINMQNWNFIALVFDLTTTTYSGSLYINGALEASGTDGIFGSPTGISAMELDTAHRGTTGVSSLIGQFIVYDDPVADLADAVSPDNFVTRVVPNADGTGTTPLTWSPTGGPANNYQAVSPPIDNTTYASNAAPSPGDRLEAETASGTTLAAQLGITPSSIKGATVHSVSLATSGTAKIGIQEGGSETLSAAQPILTSDTYLAESVANNPATGTAWVGADQPILVYEIDTV